MIYMPLIFINNILNQINNNIVYKTSCKCLLLQLCRLITSENIWELSKMVLGHKAEDKTENMNAEDTWDVFHEAFNDSVSKNIPFKMIMGNMTNKPWIDKDVKSQMNKIDRLYSPWTEDFYTFWDRIECRMQDVGCRMSDVGCRIKLNRMLPHPILSYRIGLDRILCRMLDAGSRMLDVGMLDVGTSYIQHPTSYTLHPAPYILHPASYILSYPQKVQGL